MIVIMFSTNIIVMLKYLTTFLSNQSILFWSAFSMIEINLISWKHKKKKQKGKKQTFMINLQSYIMIF